VLGGKVELEKCWPIIKAEFLIVLVVTVPDAPVMQPISMFIVPTLD
jgi:hypothetical protein